MVKQWRNEDIITPADAQRWEDGVEQSIKNNDQNAGDLKKHAEDKNNPHGVTAAQAGAYTMVETDSRDAAILQTAKAHTDTHENRKNNPHGVTAAQTGAYTKAESNANDQEILTTAKQYTDEKKAEATTFTSQEVAKVKTEIQNGNVASATKLQTSRKINGVDFDGTNDIAVVANPNQRTIAANTNLDDMVEPGFWTSHSDGNAGTLTNAPFGTSTFTLHIETGLNNTRIFQTAKSMFNGAVAVRHKREGAQWSEWTRLARADGTMQTGLFSEAANMLRTPRKIAGVDFDGTRDISIPAGNVGAYTKNETDSKIISELTSFSDNLSLSARNLLPKSSFYNGLSGWVVSGFSSVTSTGAYTRVTKGVNATRSTISMNLDGIKQSTQYTIGLMVYVESVSDGATGHGTGVFLRTNDGTMQDSPVGYVDFTKVGEWQLVTATGTTRPGAWVIPAQPTIAIQANISCTIRIKEFVLVEGNHYMGWFPAPSDKADQAELEVTQQKVKTLEENTINLTNQFPDFDFSKQTPRPIGESGVTIAYDSQGVVFNNPTANQGRASWTSPPMGLMVGKTYNVSMRVNVGAASIGRTFIVGTAQGENFTITATGQSDFWVNGTIGLTTWTGFSVWLPPHTSIRIRELYIHEANTDITTARVERIEQAVLDTVDIQYAAGSSVTVVPKWDCMAEVNVQLAGWGLDGKKWVVGLNTPAGTTQVVQGVGVLEGSNLISSHVSYTSIFTELKQGQSYTFRRETSEGQIGQAENASLIAKLYRTR